jgi:serine phosphatase RsbU (regulator of sigma subunit)
METLPPGGTHDSYLRIHAINVYVRDQERSLRFFVDTLGFQMAFDARMESGQRMVAVSPPDGSAVLALVQPDPGTPQYQLIGRATQVVFVTENVPATYREWRRRGVRFRNTPRLRRVVYEQTVPAMREPSLGESPEDHAPAWGGVFTRFEDLDRNSFALVSFDEVTRSVEAQRRAAARRLEAERRAAHELEIAKQVQSRLFPQRLPALRTLDYAGACVQTLQVGGDYYDFLDLGQERLGLVIGDIAGKGMPAALLMANLQANLRSQCAIAVEQPEELLQSVNRLFYENTADTAAYATLFYSEFDDRTRRLRYSNCGHLPGLVLRSDGEIERLDSTAPVLGLFPNLKCPTAERQLNAGDVLAIYTDGITESFNDRDEEFGEDRLIDALRKHGGRAPRDVVAAIFDEVRQFSPREQRDDVTLIVAKCKDC